MITLLKSEQTTVKKIISIADIHVRNNSRVSEFAGVFKNFFEMIKDYSKEETIIVICGDIFHQKTSTEPEGLQLVKDLFIGCSNLFPTIIIPGNHDGLVQNKNRLDAITPVVEMLNKDNIYYLKDSGLYGYANILFNHMSVFDEPEKYILGKDIPSVYKNKYEKIIGLFHGAIDQAMSDTGHVLENPKIMLPLFDNHQIILCGDIHKSQNLQEYDYQYDKPIIRYMGSMLSQNFGESADKGYSLWNLSDMSYIHYNIPNDYGFYTVGVENGKLVTDISQMPKNVRLRVICKETIPSEVKSILATIKETHNIIETSFIRETADIDTTNRTVSDINLKNIFDITYQNELIKKHLLEITPDISVTTLDKVLYINQTINKEAGAADTSTSSKYKLIRMEWSNMFRYGDDNFINFENMSGVNGIFAKNASGKSSVLNCLLFCLFDKTSTSSKGNHVLNNQKSSFKCKLELEIDDIRYFIERNGIMGRTGAVKVDVRFWKKTVNGEEIELHGTERSDTNDVIRKYVGTFDDFILTSAYFQFGKNNLSFIDMGNSDRKDILVKFIGIDVFDKLCKVANEKKKEINTELKIYKGKDYQTELTQTENAINHVTTMHNELNIELSKLKSEREVINQKTQTESLKLIKLDSNIPTNINELTSNKTKLEERITQVTSWITDFNKKSSRYTKYIRMIESSIKRIEALDLIENHKRYKTILDKIAAANKKMDIKRIEIKGRLDKVNRLKSHKYDPNCKFCIDNDFVRDATNCQEQLKQDKIIAKELMDNLEAFELEFENIKWVDSKYELYTRLLNRRGTLKDELQTLSTSILNHSNNQTKNKEILTNIINNIEIYSRNLTAVENNNSVNKVLSQYKLSASNLEVNIQKISNRITEIYGKLEVFKNNVTNLKTTIELIKNKEIELDSYEKYIAAVGRDGIPYKIICNAIPTIEKEVNDILTQITDFTLKLENDGSDIIPYISYEDKKHPVELCSGFERFVMELAIRVSLIGVSNIPSCDIYLIDEGMSALDASNLSNMETLFSILKNKFSAIIMVSHLSQMKDCAEKVIEINQVNGFSQIQYN